MTWRSFISLQTARIAARLHPRLSVKTDLPAFTFVEDGLGTIHNSDFTQQPLFQRAYSAGKATGSWREHDLRWRIHVLLWAAQHATKLEGAFVECGVYRGGFARAIIDYTGFASLSRDYYLFDTFEGFDVEQLTQGERDKVLSNYEYEKCFETVKRDFAALPFVKFVKGAVPQSLFRVGPVAFLSLDMNCAAPEIAAARFFWPDLVKGAFVLLDDYGFSLHHEQKSAFDALAAELGVGILTLPTGQGLLIKP
ncbi:MAG: hypothetical protein RL015_2734 [Verrucomicrobiota bacterium]|jgi:hypothetical protein